MARTRIPVRRYERAHKGKAPKTVFIPLNRDLELQSATKIYLA